MVLIMINGINSLLEDFHDGFVGSFSLTISMGEVFGGKMLGDCEFPIQCGNFLLLERSPNIIDYVMRNVKAIDIVVKIKLQNIFSYGIG